VYATIARSCGVTFMWWVTRRRRAARVGDAGLPDDGELTSGTGVAPRVLSLSVQPGWPQQRAQAFFEVFGQTRLRQHHRCARFKSALFDGAEGVAGEDDHGDVAGARVVF
jgi:hypothetical protein